MITLGILEVGALSLLFYYIVKYNTQQKIQYIELSPREYNELLPYINNVRNENVEGVPPPYDIEIAQLNNNNHVEINNIQSNNIQSNNINRIQNNSQNNDDDTNSLPEYSNLIDNEQNI